MKTILALDLSLSSTGYSVVQWDGKEVAVIEVGHIDNKKKGRVKWSHGKRLLRVFTELKAVINKYPEIDVIVREKGVTRFNRSTQVIFRVVGCVDLLIESTGHSPAIEIGISEAKKLITGNGRADKEEVAQEVQNFLSEYTEFQNDDESDAVAIAVAYCLKAEAK